MYFLVFDIEMRDVWAQKHCISEQNIFCNREDIAKVACTMLCLTSRMFAALLELVFYTCTYETNTREKEMYIMENIFFMKYVFVSVKVM